MEYSILCIKLFVGIAVGKYLYTKVPVVIALFVFCKMTQGNRLLLLNGIESGEFNGLYQLLTIVFCYSFLV